tara:strand:+ start:870 stop:1553 length:684 start_codon:yes stop_codon:yes gene_type:complete
MKINTALILCAGFGKRLNPLTLDMPKPLLKVNNISLLENTINLIEKLQIQNIKINTFYLQEQIKNFISNKKFNCNIEIIEDGRSILETGGGIFNLIKSTSEKDFLVLNSDTVWNLNYLDSIKKMEKFYFDNKIKNILLVVNKSQSFDKRFKGDFELKNNKLSREEKNNFIYTGCQLINRNLFNEIKNTFFSINKVWNDQIKNQELYGYESINKFVHVTDIEIYNKLN